MNVNNNLRQLTYECINYFNVVNIKPVIQSLNPWYMMISYKRPLEPEMWHTTDVQLGSVLAATKLSTQVDENRRNKKGSGTKGPKCWDQKPRYMISHVFFSDLPWNLSCRISIKHMNFMNHQEMGFGKTSSICEVNMP